MYAAVISLTLSQQGQDADERGVAWRVGAGRGGAVLTDGVDRHRTISCAHGTAYKDSTMCVWSRLHARMRCGQGPGWAGYLNLRSAAAGIAYVHSEWSPGTPAK